MTDDSLEARLAAVERTLTDGDPVADLSDAAELQGQLDALATDLDDLGERVDALEATVQSLHGYVGEIEHVNERVERRADAARAAVERLDDQPRRRPPEPSERATERDLSERSGTDFDAPTSTSGEDSAATVAHARDASTERGGEDDSLLDRLRSSL